MAKRRMDIEEIKQEQEIEAASRNGNEQPDGKIHRPKKGVFVPLNEDGSLDSTRVKDPDKLAAARSALGASAGSAVAKSDFQVNREWIPHLYDMVSMSIQSVGKLLKWPNELIPFLVYSPEQKKALTEPTAAVIERYSPTWILTHQELTIFIAAFVTNTKGMVENAVGEWLKSRMQAPSPAPAPDEKGEGVAA